MRPPFPRHVRHKRPIPHSGPQKTAVPKNPENGGSTPTPVLGQARAGPKGAMKQRILGYRTPPCHRRPVIATQRGPKGGGGWYPWLNATGGSGYLGSDLTPTPPLLNLLGPVVCVYVWLNHGRSQILDAPAQAIPANVPGVVHNQLLCYIQSLRHSLICTRASDMPLPGSGCTLGAGGSCQA